MALLPNNILRHKKDTSYRQADPDRLIASALVFKGQTNSWVLRNKLAATNLSST